MFGGPEHEGSDHVQHGTCVAPGGEEVGFRVNDEAGGSGAASGSSPASGGTRSSWTPGPRWRRRDAQARVHRARFDLPRRQERLEHRHRDRHRLAAGRAARGRRRRDPDQRRVQRPDRTGRSTRGQEHDAGPQGVRPGQPRSGDPRPLQHGGRVQPRRVVRRRLPGAARRQPRVLGRARREAGLASADGRHPLTELVLGDYLVVDTTKA